jgi:hypothetical protein
MIIVYGLSSSEDPNRIRYVGQTSKTIFDRMYGHFYDVTHNKKRPRDRWIRKCLKNGFEIVVTVLETNAGWNVDEVEWIMMIRPDLNCTPGGDGVHGVKLSSDHRAKIGLAGRGRITSQET